MDDAEQGTPENRVRRAGLADVDAMHAMIVELAAYERSSDQVAATPEDLRRALTGDGGGNGGGDGGGHGDGSPAVFAHVAETAGDAGWRVVGMALWFRTYSTWTGRHGIWLEDLYVSPGSRGVGLGRRLLAALAAECAGSGYLRLEWSVLDWNVDARAVYRAVGAREHEGWSTWRLDGEALVALAASEGERRR